MQRELREGARRPFNYWLRVGAASAGLIAVVYITAESRNETEKVMGQNLFAGLHVLLIGLICLVVPLMTADCIAREKREGTLGLLFLTPLTAGGIVAGKGLAQALRALTVWVSVAPVLAIPFVMGGIEWADASAFLALEFSVLVLCLAAGLLASTLVRGRGAAFVLALFLGALFAAVFCQLVCFLILAAFHRSSRSISALGFPYYFYLLSGLPTDFFLFPGASILIPVASNPFSLAAHRILWLSPIAALLLFVLVLRLAAWRLARSWQDKIPSLRQENLVRRYCTPVFKGLFARRMGRVLDRNPIAWLQQYSWKARLIKWVLCLAFVVMASTLLEDVFNPFNFRENFEPLLFLTIVAGMTFAGVNSFAEEKRSGALELILVTPIPINQIILGRVRGVWEQFLPAALILGSLDACLARIFGIARGIDGCLHYCASLLPFLGVFLTLPVFALYFTLRVKNQIVALGMTWFLLLLPYLFITLLVWGLVQIEVMDDFDIPEFWGTTVCPLANLALAAGAFFLLRRRLRRRLYSF